MKLRTLFLSVMGLVYLNFSYGQAFQPTDSVTLRGLENPKILWADLNNDLLYDLFLWGKAKDTLKTVVEIYTNQGNGQFEKELVDLPEVFMSQLELKDFNRDRKIDIVFTGVLEETDTVLSVLYNQSDYNYELASDTLLKQPIEQFKTYDFNYDTREDVLVAVRDEADSLNFQLFEGVVDGFELVDKNFPKFSSGKLFTIDFGSDGLQDLILSGTRNGDSTTFLLRNQGDFDFEDSQVPHNLTETIIERLSIGEWDENGFPDFFASGSTTEIDNFNILRANEGREIEDEREFLPEFVIHNSLLVDFDSDGVTDLWLQAEKNDSTFHFWYSNLEESEDSVMIYREDLIETRFADYTFDGHIDYTELIHLGDSLKLTFFESLQPSINKGPGKPEPQVAVQTGRGQVRVAWQAASDSLTNSSSLSYDAIFLSSDTTELFEANMGEGNFWPNFAYHGNQLYSGKLDLDSLEAGEYYYLVRGIDNAFNYLGGNGGGGIGDGSEDLNKITICDEELTVSNVDMCNGSFETFGTEGVLRNWYSDRLGAIGETDILTYIAGGVDDVIYGTVVDFVNCSEGQLEIHVNVVGAPAPLLIPSFTLVCGPETLEFELDEAWSNVQWSSSLLGEFSSDHSISLDITQSDTLSVVATNDLGCKFRAQGIISFVDFRPAVADTVYNIELGESVQLSASGGGEYIWGPVGSLNNPFIANPVASPRETTVYNVIVRSEENCVERFQVTVNVEQVGNAANLFTPNGDNRNDSFFLQLSSVPVAIDFRIYSREGNLIYREREPIRAVSQGWDGRFNGKKMPPGVYYWRVEGLYADGTRVKVNSDNSGKVHLIR